MPFMGESARIRPRLIKTLPNPVIFALCTLAARGALSACRAPLRQNVHAKVQKTIPDRK
jgi:hypothetical protein